MRIVRTGITRTVFLIGSVAIKVPTLRYGYSKFLAGLMANVQERTWWRDTGNDRRLCPVICSSRLGLWLVMRLAQDIDECSLPTAEAFDCLPLDYKLDSFGMLNGQVVLRDYGS